MNCELARQKMTLFVHGELNFDEEEQLERHTASCPFCSPELALERAVLDLADANRLEPSLAQLATARQALANRIAAEQTSRRYRLGARLEEWFDFHPGLRWSLQPIAGLLLLGAGYLGGSQPSLHPFDKASHQAGFEATPTEQRVRFVKSAPGGQVELLVDEIHQTKVRGTVEDPSIRELLLTAAKDPDDAGLRAEVFDVLKGRTEAIDVRAALISSLDKDPSSEVRMKVLESLRPYAAYPDVRRAMSKALLGDTSAEVRIMAIDMLVSVDKPDVAGTLQKLLENEPDQYLRQRSQAALVAMKASTNTF